jgi:hypothetical protein
MASKLQVKVALVGPRTVTQADPLVVTITKCMTGVKRGWGTNNDPFPGTVKIAIIERDTWSGGGDDLVPDNNKKHPHPALQDDLVIEFEGHFEINASKKGANFIVDEDKAAAALVTNKNMSPDRIWLNFEGRNGDPFELSVPRDAAEGDEGFFLEISAVITEIPVKMNLETQVVPVSRVRTPHTVLAVEPLSQSKMSAGLALNLIMSVFHSNAADKKKLEDRSWSKFMLRRTDDTFFESMLVDSACSLIVLTMVLRYLRVPDGQGGLVSLYDKVVTPLVEGKTLEAKYAPREFLWNAKSAKEALEAAYVVPSKPAAERAKAQAKRDALAKALADAGKTTDADFFGIEFSETKHADGSEEAKQFVRAASLSKDTYWPVMLLWYLRQKESIEESYDVKLLKAFKQVVVEDDGGTRVVLERLAAGDMVQAAKPKGTETGTYLTKRDGHALPATSAVRTVFGLDSQDIDTTTLQEGWGDKIKQFIDDGLPVIGIFSPGIYSKAIGLEKTSGHWCLFVGYRTDETGERSFILNDPARGNAPQYDVLREDQLHKFLVDNGYDNQEPPPGSGNNKPKDRELKGWNLPIERRKLMTLRRIYVLTPKGWVPNDHRHTLLYDGRSKWTEKSG